MKRRKIRRILFVAVVGSVHANENKNTRAFVSEYARHSTRPFHYGVSRLSFLPAVNCLVAANNRSPIALRSMLDSRSSEINLVHFKFY